MPEVSGVEVIECKAWYHIPFCVFLYHQRLPKLGRSCSGVNIHSSVYLMLKRRFSVTNFSSENNLPMFQLNVPVVIRAHSVETSASYFLS